MFRTTDQIEFVDSPETREGLATWAGSWMSLLGPWRLASQSSSPVVQELVGRSANALSLALLTHKPEACPYILRGIAANPRLSRHQAHRVAEVALLYLIHPHRGQFDFDLARDALWEGCRRYGAPLSVIPSLLSRLDSRDDKLWPNQASRTRQECLLEVLLGLEDLGEAEIRQAVARLPRRSEALLLATHPACPAEVQEHLQKEVESRLERIWTKGSDSPQMLLNFLMRNPSLLSLPWLRQSFVQRSTESDLECFRQTLDQGEMYDWGATLAVERPEYLIRWMKESPDDFSAEEKKELLKTLLASKESETRLQAMRISSHVLSSGHPLKASYGSTLSVCAA